MMALRQMMGCQPRMFKEGLFLLLFAGFVFLVGHSTILEAELTIYGAVVSSVFGVASISAAVYRSSSVGWGWRLLWLTLFLIAVNLGAFMIGRVFPTWDTTYYALVTWGGSMAGPAVGVIYAWELTAWETRREIRLAKE